MMWFLDVYGGVARPHSWRLSVADVEGRLLLLRRGGQRDRLAWSRVEQNGHG